ncbi:unnamed protein product [Prorocentrum cordatum]|uniref:Subtilisin n=1 Tax=Prorocentrum cordatum TaxID=2364126 RepID=A0ABN9XE24_9DINO|nr:unnamed protein product [Polarella glacialis]
MGCSAQRGRRTRNGVRSWSELCTCSISLPALFKLTRGPVDSNNTCSARWCDSTCILFGHLDRTSPDAFNGQDEDADECGTQGGLFDTANADLFLFVNILRCLSGPTYSVALPRGS